MVTLKKKPVLKKKKKAASKKTASKKTASKKPVDGQKLVNISRAAQMVGVQYGTIRDAIEQGYLQAASSYEGSGGKTFTLITVADLEAFRKVLIERYSVYKNDFHGSKVSKLQAVGNLC